MASERRVQKRQPTQTADHHEHAQNSRQECRPENEVPDQGTIESEKHKGDVEGLAIQSERQIGQRLQLFRTEDAQVSVASQKDQGSYEKDTDRRLNSASHQAEKRCEQRQVPVHRPEQLVQQSRYRD